MFHDPEVFARLVNWLFTHRSIRTRVPKGTRFKDGEKDLAGELDLINEDERAYLEDFFSFSGFALKIFDWTDYPGIPTGGQVWGIVRSGNRNAPGWISQGEARSRIALKPEPKNTTTVWAFVVYLHYLHLVYTKLDRHPQEVSRYVDAVFSKEALVQTVRDFVSRLGEEHANETPAISLLMEESGMEIERRVSNLLGFLEATGCISFNKHDQAYSQTLLGAADVAEHYDWEISYLLPQKDIDVDALSHIVIQDDTEKDFSNEPHQ